MDLNTEVLFEVAEDALLVANGGRPFTPEGVISISASHLSEKVAYKPLDDYEIGNESLVGAICARVRRKYRNDVNDIWGDSGDEHETRRGYGGRFLWELLQNADDAMGGVARTSADLIGSKGLGFKSVLEITEEPEVHSGPFHFRFSVSRTQELLRGILREKRIRREPPPLIFRIPHDCRPNQAVQRLLDDGFATVVRLPFRDQEARKKVTARLQDLDPSFLLLSHEIRRVRIRDGKTPKVIEVKREQSGLSDGDVDLIDVDSVGVHRTSWRRWVSDQEAPGSDGKRLTVAICLPLDQSGDAIAGRKSSPLYVFFPTEERHGARALIHASFDLQTSRKHLCEGPHDDAIIEELKQLLERVLLEVPARTVLEAFGHVELRGNGSSFLERLRGTIRSTVESTPFVPVLGGVRVKPCDVRLWKDRLGDVLREDVQEVRDAHLLVPDLNDLRPVLEKFDAEKISNDEHIRLLRHCRNDSLETCFESFRALIQGGLKRVPSSWHDEDRKRYLAYLRAVPCWWTKDGDSRGLNAHPPLLLRRPSGWPSWLPGDTLHPRMRKAVENWEKRAVKRQKERRHNPSDTLDEWNDLICGWLPRKPQEFLDWVLLPFIGRWDDAQWKSEGWHALSQIAKWFRSREFEQIKLWVRGGESSEADRRRTEIATKLRLPTDKGWLPAGDCYVGKAWDGPAEFDGFFAGKAGRGLVSPFGNWPSQCRKGTKRDFWKALLRFAGVSWEPKMCLIEGWLDDDLWHTYRHHAGIEKYKHQKKDWEIDYFPDCIITFEKFSSLLFVLEPLIQKTHDLRAVYLLKWGGSDYYPNDYMSFADYQLRRVPWLPYRRCLLHIEPRISPSDAYLRGSDLGGLLPAVVRPPGVDDEEWGGRILPLLKNLGVSDELPNEPERWHEWLRRLPEACQALDEKEWRVPQIAGTEGGGLMWESARALYVGYMRLPVNEVRVPEDVPIPCTVWRDGHERVEFAAAKEIAWVDEAHLDVPEVRRSLLKRKYKLFVLRLNAGKKAPDRLRIRPLSEVVWAKAHYVASEERESQPLAKRYKERRLALTKAAGLDKPLPESLAIEGVRNLRLSLRTGQGAIAEVEVLAWSGTNDSLLVNLDKNTWRALANGLACRIINKKDKQPLFETLLGVTEEQELIDRLREQGLTESDIQEVEADVNLKRENGSEDNDDSTPVAEAVGDGGESGREKEEKNSEGAVIGKAAGSQNIGLPEGGGGGDVTRHPNAPRPETGFRAEDWLAEKLQEAFPKSVDRRVRDEKGRESDFVFSVRSGKVHIEAKNVNSLPGTIFWSDLQCEKARELQRNGQPYLVPREQRARP